MAVELANTQTLGRTRVKELARRLAIATLERRMLGAFDTPEPLAEFLVSWAIRSPVDKIIDPCCGAGVFLEASAKRLLFLGAEPSFLGSQMTGIEISPSQAEVSSQ